ncbi:MAG: UDP-N-acetylglucosamine 1-carboxyvinyltransferase [Deltaproteobacteria bacterium]|nr:MAG: UDP-N-acetylglucosamine 1-carboxyvinyltransferase [Deltaproteobacteria bacterium]
MDKIVVAGGRPLNGEIQTSGAKNAALPILVATLLAPGEHRITNLPNLVDISSTLSLLGRIGCPSLFQAESTRVDTTRIAFSEAPYDVVRKMRASVLVLGPLLARHGACKVSLPGGCAIGVRPIDQHLKGLEALGARFELSGGYINGRADGLRGAEINLDMPTVTGTENILMAATLAEGTSVIHNAAREPEIVDLANFLISLGARIEGAGTSTLTIHGVPRLSPASRPYRVLPDRIEAGTYLCAAAIAGGNVTVTRCEPSTLTAVIDKLREAGCEITVDDDRVTCARTGELRPFHVDTQPHPGFPTDMQAQLMAVACIANGTSTFRENIFENRYMHAAELLRMGARIDVQGRVATVRGVPSLTGASVMASDLRASAALVLSGLAAQGVTQVLRIYHLDRGYEDMTARLRGVGASIARLADDADEQAVQASLRETR